MTKLKDVPALASVPAGGYVLVSAPYDTGAGLSDFAKVPATALGGGGPGGGYTPIGTTAQLLDGTGGNVTVGSGLALNSTTHTLTASGTAAGVASFNTRTGAVTLSSADVTGALTYTPYNATNPSGYQTAAQVTAVLPGVATASTPGLVKPDGTSIVIDGTGKITSTVSGGFTPGGTTAQLLSGTGSNVTVGTGLTLTSGTLTAAGGGPALPGGTAGQIQFNSAGTALGGFTMGGDATLNTGTGVITVTKTNGTAFGAVATAAYGSANPAMDSGATGGPGVATTISRSDHFHPSDTSRAAIGGAAFTGAISAPSLALTTPLPLTSGGVGSATASGARTNLALDKVAFDVDFSQGAIVANGTITVVRKSPFAFTINSMDYEVGSAGGSFTVATRINATPVTGLSAVAVSSATSANAAATAANSVAAGDQLTLVISALSGSPTGANLQINGTR